MIFKPRKRHVAATLWLREGDAMEYTSYGTDLYAVIDALRELGVHDVSAVRGGITAPGFEGANYISLYWGDKSANLVSPITKGEFMTIRRALSSRGRKGRNPRSRGIEIEVHRKPTKSEIKFGYGCWHHKYITVKTPPKGGQKFKIDGQTWTYGSRHNPSRCSRHKRTRANPKRGLFSRIPWWAWVGVAAGAWMVTSKLKSKGPVL